MTPKFWRQWLKRRRGNVERPAPWRWLRFRPTVEVLEDRLAPAIVDWIGPAGGNWSTAANWFNESTSTNVAPTASDIATFSSAHNTNSTIDNGFAGSVAGINLTSGYTATVTDSNAALAIGGQGLVMASGTFDLNGNSLTLTSLTGGGGTVTNNSSAADATLNITARSLVADPGFETSASLGPWSVQGTPTTSGVDTISAQAHSGSNSGFIQDNGGDAFLALTQPTVVAPNTNYTLTAWIDASNTTLGVLAAKTGGGVTIASTAFVNSASGPNPLQADYQRYTVSFNSGSNTTVIISAGYTAPNSASFMNLDDVSLIPAPFAGNLTDGSNGHKLGLTVNGVFTGGPELFALSGSNTYSGPTSVTNGATLQAGSTGGFSPNSNVTLDGNTSAKLDLNGFNSTVHALLGGGSPTPGIAALVTNSSSTADATLTVANSAPDTYAGNLADGSGHKLGLTVGGSSTLTLSGTDSATGPVTIGSGTTLLAAPASPSASIPGTVTVNANGTLDVNGLILTVNGLFGSGIVTNNGATDGTLVTGGTFSGTLKDGIHRLGIVVGTAATLTLSGNNTYSGGTSLAGGNIVAGSTSALGSIFAPLTFSHGLGTGGGVLDLNGFNISIGGTSGGSTGDGITNSSATPATLTVNLFGAADSFGGNLIGNLGLTVAASGSLTLSGSNSNTGPTTVSGGSTLIAGSSGATSPNSAVTLNSGGSLNVSGFSVAVGGLFGSGAVVNASGSPSFTVDVTGNDTFNGTLASNLVLTVGGTGTFGLVTPLPNNPLTVNAGATFNMNGINSTVPAILGGGTITNNSATSDATLTVANTAPDTFAGSLTDGNAGHKTALTVNGPSTLTLTGSSTNNGATTLSAGTLLVNGSMTSTTLLEGGTLGGLGTVGKITQTFIGPATVTPGNQAVTPAGTLTSGNVVFEPGTTFAPHLSNLGSELLNVNGTVQLGTASSARFSASHLRWVPYLRSSRAPAASAARSTAWPAVPSC
jgi:autotransporter-associated beta strand protein